MLFSVILASLPAVLAVPARRSEPAPLRVPNNSELIQNKYIVKFKDGASAASADGAMNTLSQGAEQVYDTVFRGFAGSLDDEALKALRDHPDVDFIEQDSIARTYKYVTEEGAPWGLARISKDDPDGNFDYTYDDSAGKGTCAYVIDTGVDDGHYDFGGRAEQVKSFIYGSNEDDNGHGTHVAGTIGGNRFGVAKKTKIYGVKVLDAGGSGAYSAVIAGMDWVAKDSKTRKCPKGHVANMSLGGGYSDAVNAAANRMAESGVFLAVAAGNSNADLHDFSPASAAGACSAGATNNLDQRAVFSNFGSGLDVFAPGVDILSAFPDNQERRLSGTSMASPHLAGLGAYFAAYKDVPTHRLCEYIKKKAHDKVVLQPENTTPLLIFNHAPKL